MENAKKQTVGKFRKYHEGDLILTEGERNHCFYKIVSGKAEVYQKYKEPGEYLIGIYGEGRYFGDVAFLTGSVSKYTVVACTNMLVLAVEEEEFSDYVSRNTINAIDIMKNLARSVETLNKHVELISEEMDKIQESGKPVPINLKEKISQYKHWI